MFEDSFEVNGRSYIGATYNKCPVCADRDPPHYMLVRYKVAGGDKLLECPHCDYNITLNDGQIIHNANKSE